MIKEFFIANSLSFWTPFDVIEVKLFILEDGTSSRSISTGVWFGFSKEIDESEKHE